MGHSANYNFEGPLRKTIPNYEYKIKREDEHLLKINR